MQRRGFPPRIPLCEDEESPPTYSAYAYVYLALACEAPVCTLSDVFALLQAGSHSAVRPVTGLTKSHLLQFGTAPPVASESSARSTTESKWRSTSSYRSTSRICEPWRLKRPGRSEHCLGASRLRNRRRLRTKNFKEGSKRGQKIMLTLKESLTFPTTRLTWKKITGKSTSSTSSELQVYQKR